MLIASCPSAAQICRVKVATEVFPLVPVTATITSGCAPNHKAAAQARAARESSTTTSATSVSARASTASFAPAVSVSTAAAPCSSAAPMKVAPCTDVPGKAANSMPARTARLSAVSPDSAGSRPALAVSPRSDSRVARAAM